MNIKTTDCTPAKRERQVAPKTRIEYVVVCLDTTSTSSDVPDEDRFFVRAFGSLEDAKVEFANSGDPPEWVGISITKIEVRD